jgi:hypothetical protein
MSFLATLALGTSLLSARTPATGVREMFGVCIVHAGEQDKPIMPIVVAINAQSENACRRVVNDWTGLKLAVTIRVSREQLTAIADRIHAFANKGSGLGQCVAFGTFDWVVLKGDQKAETQTCPEESVKLLSDLLAISKDKELNDALRDTLARLRAN